MRKCGNKTSSSFSEISQEAVAEVHKKVQNVVDNISSNADVSLHTKRWEHGLPFKIPSFRKKSFDIKKILINTGLAVLLFSVLFFAAHVASSFLMQEPAEEAVTGVPAVVICEKCGNVETKPVTDIRDSKCSKCGGQEWYAVKCSKCGKYFPLNEDKFNDEDLDDDEVDSVLEQRYTCPFCGNNESEKELSVKR